MPRRDRVANAIRTTDGSAAPGPSGISENQSNRPVYANTPILESATANPLLRITMPADTFDQRFPERLPLNISTIESTATLELVAQRPWVDEETRDSLARASIVFVPWERFRDLDEPVFPVMTGDLYQYVRDHAPPGFHGEIALQEDRYSEVALHADVVFLPTILVFGAGSIVIPVAVNLISEWLKQRLLERHKEADVKFEMISQQPNGEVKAIRYEGPAASFEKLMLEHARKTGLLSPEAVGAADTTEIKHLPLSSDAANSGEGKE